MSRVELTSTCSNNYYKKTILLRNASNKNRLKHKDSSRIMNKYKIQYRAPCVNKGDIFGLVINFRQGANFFHELLWEKRRAEALISQGTLNARWRHVLEDVVQRFCLMLHGLKCWMVNKIVTVIVLFSQKLINSNNRYTIIMLLRY